MNTVVLVLLSILLPPLSIYLTTKSGLQVLLSLVLCIAFWIPAVLHALYFVLKK